MFIITGGAGFIGSAFTSFLNQKGINDIIVVDVLESSERWKNLRGKKFAEYFHRDEFIERLKSSRLPFIPKAVIHLGACSSTTEKNADFLMANNYRYSIEIAEFCMRNDVRLIYASSAATYGNGARGYSDAAAIENLEPLNPYGFSKHAFDCYMQRHHFGRLAVGLKFFNVFGPNEYHKGEMKSVVFKAWEQISRGEKVSLFRSYRSDFSDGEQKRDFVYVKDCCEVMWWLLQHPEVQGIYNLGSGKARSWNDLVKAVYHALHKEPLIEYVEMPTHLRSQYQYFTEASMGKLASSGFKGAPTSLEDGVRDYVVNYLDKGPRYY